MSKRFPWYLVTGLILWLIRHLKRGTLVEDHPTRAGCYAIES